MKISVKPFMFLLQVTALSVGSDSSTPFETDYLRLFSDDQSEEEFVDSSRSYTDARVANGNLDDDRRTPDLVLVVPFDDTALSKTPVTIFSADGELTKVEGNINPDSVTTSTIPIVKTHETLPNSGSVSSASMNACSDAFNDTKLIEHCADGVLGDSVEEFFYQTCLQVVSNGADNADMISDMYTLTCASVTDTNECEFENTMDMCENDEVPEEEEEIGEQEHQQAAASSPVIAAAAGSIVFIIIGVVAAIILIAYIRRRKKKKEEEDLLKQQQEEEDVESAAGGAPPTATTLPKQPALPPTMKKDFEDKDLHKWNQAEDEKRMAEEEKKRKAHNAKMLDLLKNMQAEVGEDDAAEVAQFSNWKQERTKSMASIDLDVASRLDVTSPSTANGMAAASTAMPSADKLLGSTPKPGAQPAGRASQVGRITPAEAAETLKQHNIPNLSAMMADTNKTHTKSLFDNKAISVRELMTKKPRSKPSQPEGLPMQDKSGSARRGSLGMSARPMANEDIGKPPSRPSSRTTQN